MTIDGGFGAPGVVAEGAASQAGGADVLHRIRQELTTGHLPTEAFNSEELHALEQERVFSRAWCFLAHESEIPESGDFVRRTVAGNAVIVTRDASGRVRCFLNMCRHRGMQLCKVDAGNAAHHRCSYHGWTYANDGRLVAVPYQQVAYGDSLRREDWGLVEARTDAYEGLVFGCLDTEAEPLADFLGDFRFYLDLYLKPGPAGTEVYAPPNRWVADMNWKYGAENFGGDGYHTPVAHQFGFRLGYYPSAARTHADGVCVHVPGRGHAIGLGRTPGLRPFAGFDPEAVARMRRVLSDEQLAVLEQIRSAPATVFPNLSFLMQPLSVVPGEPGTWFTTMRLWNPIGANRMQMISWCLVPVDAPAEAKDAAYRAYTLAFGQAGTFEQDDFENWTCATRMAGEPLAQACSFPYTMGMGSEPDHSFGGPGVAVRPYVNDTSFRAMWGHWLDMLERA
jgi:nitrite reductase/ring-hydroxylating ferredoxin subunit